MNRRLREIHCWSGRFGDCGDKTGDAETEKCLKLEVLPDVTLYQLVTAIGVPCHARRLEFFILKNMALRSLETSVTTYRSTQ
jgi:hypothetical protein